MKKIILVLLAVIMALLLSGCKSNTAVYPFEITVFGVGKADAILIRADGHYMLSAQQATCDQRRPVY